MNNTVNDLCIGIDLGTTNSVLATINQKANGELVSKVVELPRAVDVFSASGKIKPQLEKKATLPSCVYYNEDMGYRPIVGNFAKNRFAVRPHLVAKSIKSHMGEKDTSNLNFADEIPDKTPAEISARILEHMLKTAGKIFHHQITEAVITVPASFDSMMVKATRDAAELAGIKVLNDDGTERPILLEEPKAVIFDFINQLANGEISKYILDLDEKKQVMVFDLGGGTLDITLHEIKRREDYPDIIKIDDIAINRYTLLGGDDFDKALAQEMYRRFLKQFQGHDDIIRKLKKDEKSIMSQLLTIAEELKMDLSAQHSGEVTVSDDSGWGWGDEEDDTDAFPVGGNIGSTGYSYDDTFTKEEIEAVFRDFMGYNLNFDDYKQLDNPNFPAHSRNIIYPILDVLHKAAQKLGTDNVKVDAVILNGGMSKFYMVKDRLTQFFGFEPIEALDPDQAVARGAAVYHYYLKKYDYKILGEDMRKAGTQTVKDSTPPVSAASSTDKKPPVQPPHIIEWGRNILNDSLYLGNANGNQTEIIPTGVQLPFRSDYMKGFQLMPNTTAARIDIPIRVKAGVRDQYRTIASGKIEFKRIYPDGTFVILQVFMSASKIITMKAWTCEDVEGEHIIEEGSTEISITNSTATRQKNKLLSPQGSPLNAPQALNVLDSYCYKFENTKMKQQSTIAAKIKTHISHIYTASNPQDFAQPLLGTLLYARTEEYKCRCLIIARRIGIYWNDADRTELAKLALAILSPELQGIDLVGFSRGRVVNTRMQAIYALSICGREKDLETLKQIRTKRMYRNACLYTFAKQHYDIDWLWENLQKDYEMMTENKEHRNLQNSLHAIGVSFNDYQTDSADMLKLRNDVAGLLQNTLKNQNCTGSEIICCIIALGCVCDQRYTNPIEENMLNNIREMLTSIENYISWEHIKICLKSRDIALKLLSGTQLNAIEEQYLLKKLDIADK